jgi:quercetin dioxygenase-like cupin family protein
MGRTAGVTHGHKSRAVQEEKMDKDLAHIPPGEGGTSLWVFGELVTHKIPSHKTGGAYALFEVTTPPGAGSPPHAHHREDESFYVMEGEYEFLIEGGTIRVRAGSLLYFPKGTLHAHRGSGEGAGKMLVTQTPGGLYERFFEEVGAPSDGGSASLAEEDRLDLETIADIGAECGIEMAPPAARSSVTWVG